MTDLIKDMLLQKPDKKIIHKLFFHYQDFMLLEKEYEYEEIFPKVFIYKNMFSSIEEAYQILKDATSDSSLSFLFKDWVSWGGKEAEYLPFGKYIDVIGNFFTDPQTDKEINKALKEQELLLEVVRAFFATTNHFMKKFNIQKNELWGYTNPSFCKYIPLEEQCGQNTAINYHTDYMIERASEPGEKFSITTTMYINDDYSDGEILFKTKQGEFIYKPVAGDILVFPSGHPSILMEGDKPIMHAVNPIPFDGPDRYMVRMFHYIYSQGDNVRVLINNNERLNKETENVK